MIIRKLEKPTYNIVVDIVKEHGPMNAAQVTEYMKGWAIMTIRVILHRAVKAGDLSRPWRGVYDVPKQK